MILLSKEQEERLSKVIDKFPQVKDIAQKFNDAGIKWAIAAGTAVYIYCGGDDSLLDDVDIWIASESKERVAEILGTDWQPQSSERHKAENIQFGSFDVFINCRKFREEEQLLDYQWTKLSEDHLREEAIDEVNYKIVSPEDVVVLKKPNAREKDKADIVLVEKIGLDNDYLQKRFNECNSILKYKEIA